MEREGVCASRTSDQGSTPGTCENSRHSTATTQLDSQTGGGSRACFSGEDDARPPAREDAQNHCSGGKRKSNGGGPPRTLRTATLRNKTKPGASRCWQKRAEVGNLCALGGKVEYRSQPALRHGVSIGSAQSPAAPLLGVRRSRSRGSSRCVYPTLRAAQSQQPEVSTPECPPVGGWMNKYGMSTRGISLCLQKERNSDTCRSVDAP